MRLIRCRGGKSRMAILRTSTFALLSSHFIFLVVCCATVAFTLCLMQDQGLRPLARATKQGVWSPPCGFPIIYSHSANLMISLRNSRQPYSHSQSGEWTWARCTDRALRCLFAGRYCSSNMYPWYSLRISTSLPIYRLCWIYPFFRPQRYCCPGSSPCLRI